MVRQGTVLRFESMLGESTNRRETDYDCLVAYGSVIVKCLFSLIADITKENMYQVWPLERCNILRGELMEDALSDPEMFLKTLIECEGENNDLNDE